MGIPYEVKSEAFEKFKEFKNEVEKHFFSALFA